MTIGESFRRIAVGVVIASIAAVAVQSPTSAQSVRPNGYPVTNVNLRAGPGTYYPALLVVPARSPIRILGCLGDYTWCDVIFQGYRGWMRSIYLQGWYRGYYYSLRDYAPRLGYPMVTFDVGRYWDANYRDRPFYRDRGRWGGSYGEGWTDRASFYGRLAPYGDWIWLEGQYVWVPEDVGPHWRPYTVGRWVYTDRYGWMWSSREPFGWATYHYGRWGFSRRVGWFWVPGSRWAPAWVSWRQSNDYLAWAPLPPTADEGLGLSIRIGTIPDYYWQVVPNRDFLDDDLPQRIVRDRDRFNPILRETQPLGNVTVVNNTTVVNNVVNITYVEEKTRKKVVVHKVEKTKDEKKSGKVEGASIEVFQPAADQAPAAVAPAAPKPIEEVAAGSKTKGQAEGAATTEELLVPKEVQKTPETKAEAATPPPPPPPPAEAGAPAAEEEAAAPPPPGPPAEKAVPLPPEEAAPPPPPPAAAKEAAPLPPQEAVPPPRAPEETPPPVEEAPPPPAPADQAAPPPSPAEAAPQSPPPAAKEATPPPPPAPPAEEPKPKVKKEGKPKKDRGEQAVPEENLPPAPPPPPAEQAPPPPQDMTPPPPYGEEAPQIKKNGKFRKDKGEEPMPEMLPPAPPVEGGPPPPPNDDDQGKAKRDGKPNKGKGKRDGAPPELCPEGMVLLEDGSCAPMQ